MGAALKKAFLSIGAAFLVVSFGCETKISYDTIEQKDKERTATAKRMPGYNSEREPTSDR